MTSGIEDDEVLVTERTYRLSFFKCPRYSIMILVMLIVYAITWFVMYPGKTDRMWEVFLILVMPTVLSTFVVPLLGFFEDEMRFQQSFLLALISMMITSFFILLYDILRLNVPIILLVGYAIPVSLRYIVFRTVFITHPFKPLAHTIFQSAIALPFIHIFFPLSDIEVVLFSLLVGVGISSALAFLELINRPFVNDFGVSGMELIRTAYRLYVGKEEGKEDLEDLFKKTSIKSDVNYTIFSFKTKNREKALFIIPELHPGPIKGIGGSMLPELLANELEGKHGKVFTFHGCSTHVQNPISKEDCYLLVDEIKGSMDTMHYTNVGTSFYNIHEGIFVGAQILGEGLFMTVSFSPHPTEDIDAPIGEIVSLKARDKGINLMGFVDAHNCIRRGAMEVYYPSRRYGRIIDGSDEMMNAVMEREMGLIEMGVASKGDYVKSEGIGGDGIKVAVFRVNGRKNALVLIDGNNMESGLREKIQDEISDLVDISEVHTTDSHEVNTLVKGYNPVGFSMDHTSIIEDVREVTQEAVDDLEPVHTGVNKGVLHNFPLMGPIGSNRLTAVIETVYQVSPLAGGMTFAIQFLATSVVLSLL